MWRRPPGSTRTDILFPHPPLFRSLHSRPHRPGSSLAGVPGLVAPLRGLCSPCQAAALLVRSTMKRVSRYLLVGKARKRPTWVNLGNSGAVLMNLLIWRIVGRASAPAQRRPLRSDEHPSVLLSLMRYPYYVYCSQHKTLAL